MLDSGARRFFKVLNRFFMIPMFRLGLGFFFGNPFTGYIMVMRMVGRKTGKVRYVPVNYAIHNGNVYCVAGFGKTSHWYRNLQAQPQVELMLPGGALTGMTEDVTDPEERLTVSRQIFKNGGFAGFFEGFNPFTAPDSELVDKLKEVPVLRIHPIGIGRGAGDPHGWAWIWSIVITVAVVALLVG